MADRDGPDPGPPTAPVIRGRSLPQPVAFVLSGGGSFGAAQVGMLRALAEIGLVPDLVVGASVGALNGAVLASDPAGAHHRLADIWGRLDRRTVFGPGIASATWRLVRTRRSLCDPRGVEALVREHLAVDDFDDLALPLVVVATDLLAGRPVSIRTGTLRDALAASIAIPGVFPRVTIGDRVFVDGGVSANVPVRQALEAGAASVVVLDANPATIADDVPRGLAAGLLATVRVMLHSQRSGWVDDASPLHDEVGAPAILVLPSVTPAGLSSFDFSRTDELIVAAHRAARAFVAGA